jgi:hypothetical protein
VRTPYRIVQWIVVVLLSLLAIRALIFTFSSARTGDAKSIAVGVTISLFQMLVLAGAIAWLKTAQNGDR